MLAVGFFWLGAILVILATLMLFVDSFKHRRLWSIISLILLIPLVIHMFLNWSSLNSRKAFYLILLGILSIAVSIAGGALSKVPYIGENEVVKVLEDNIAPAKDEPLPNQEQADAAALSAEGDYDPLLTGSEYESLESKEIVPENINKTNPNASTARYQLLALGELPRAVNKWVRIKVTDGEIIEGRLTDVLEDGVLVESSVNGGSLGLSYNNDEISELFVRLEAGESLGKLESDEPAVDEISSNVDSVNEPLNQDAMPSNGNRDEEQADEEFSSKTMIDEGASAIQDTTQAVLKEVETMVDDSKSVEQTIGQ